MRISDWSSDVCSSDLSSARHAVTRLLAGQPIDLSEAETAARGLELLAEQPFDCIILDLSLPDASGFEFLERLAQRGPLPPVVIYSARDLTRDEDLRLREYTDSIVIKRSEEHTSEIQSLMRRSYAVFCLKKKTTSKLNCTSISLQQLISVNYT